MNSSVSTGVRLYHSTSLRCYVIFGVVFLLRHSDTKVQDYWVLSCSEIF